MATTEDLRATLFATIEDVRTGKMDRKDALAVASLSKTIVDTARLELEASRTLSRLDKDDQGVTTGPLMLTQKPETETAEA